MYDKNNIFRRKNENTMKHRYNINLINVRYKNFNIEKEIYGKIFQLLIISDKIRHAKIACQQKISHFLMIYLKFAIDYLRSFTVLACVFIHQMTRQIR